MSAADSVNTQFMGAKGGPSDSFGWKGLAPQPDNEDRRFSQFRAVMNSHGGPVVDRQTLVEAIGTLVFEATFRIKSVTDVDKAKEMTVAAKRGETVLGHAAVASGLAITNNELLNQILAEVKK